MQSTSQNNSRPLLISIALFALTLLLISRSPLNLAFLLIALVQTTAIVALFWISALGLALPLRKFSPQTINHWTLQAALGAALLSFLFWIAAHFPPLLNLAPYLLTPGLILILHQAHKSGVFNSQYKLTLPNFSPYITLIAIPAALILGHTTIAPGLLWSPTEFSGYDALSYHLGLQYDWLQSSAITPLTHNVYSYLPNLTESLYLTIAHTLSPSSSSLTNISPLAGIHPLAGVAAQLLHASFALLTAALITRLVFILTNQKAPALATGALYLAIPWTLVTASLAYNEQTMLAFAMAATLIILNTQNDSNKHTPYIIAGFLIALSALAKLTALPTFALPLGLIILLRPSTTTRQKLTAATLFTLATFITLAPFLFRNYSWTSNPLFPMFATTLPSAHWTAEQAARWATAHQPNHSILKSLTTLFNQGPAHLQFAYIICPLTLASIIITFKRNRYRHTLIALLIILTTQLLFWLFMTHQQSRFLIPLLPPALTILGLAFAASIRTATTSNPNSPLGLGLTGAVILTTTTSLFLTLTQNPTTPLFIHGATLMQSPPTTTPNYSSPTNNTPPLNIYHAINSLPPDSKIYSEAFATPYYINRSLNYHTVWDTAPLATQLAITPNQAHAWLLNQNYTHLLIDNTMLTLWTSPNNYGYDPNLTPQSLKTLTNSLQPILHLPTNSPNHSLYKITPLTP